MSSSYEIQSLPNNYKYIIAKDLKGNISYIKKIVFQNALKM